MSRIRIVSSMNEAIFEARAISAFHDLNFAFCEEFQQGGSLKRMPAGQYAGMLAVGALVGLGAFMINNPSFSDGEVKAALAELGSLCDLLGIRLSTGVVRLAIFVHYRNLTDEAVIGKCQLIHNRLASFKQFAMRIGWTKYPVSADVFFVFDSSEKAFHFRNAVQEHCKHYAIFNKLWVLPWGIDLVAKNFWAYTGLPINWLKPADIEAKLFS